MPLVEWVPLQFEKSVETILENISRREFIGRAGYAGLYLSSHLLGTSQALPVLRVALWLPREPNASFTSINNQAMGGARLALKETGRAAELFGKSVLLSDARSKGDAPTAMEVRTFIRSHTPAFLCGGIGETDCRILGDVADETGTIFLNIGTSADSFRRDACRRNTFHVAASDAMIAAARSAAPNTTASTNVQVSPAGSPQEAKVAIELWDASLERFGAAQLNDRYKALMQRPMSSHAWAAWMAVKIAWEASLAARSHDSHALIAHLERSATRFDGHKGAPLSFREWDHQLRQPLYAVTAAGAGRRVLAELPDVSRNAETPMRDLLDRFGDGATEAGCRMRSRT